jgi:hypothetical protein
MWNKTSFITKLFQKIYCNTKTNINHYRWNYPSGADDKAGITEIVTAWSS